MLKMMIYDSLIHRKNGHFVDGGVDGGVDAGADGGVDGAIDNVIDSVNDVNTDLGHEAGHNTRGEAVGLVSGSSAAAATEPVADIGTPREKLREIRDWHLSKAQMSWSLETQQRHQQFANWLDEAIDATEI